MRPEVIGANNAVARDGASRSRAGTPEDHPAQPPSKFCYSVPAEWSHTGTRRAASASALLPNHGCGVEHCDVKDASSLGRGRAGPPRKCASASWSTGKTLSTKMPALKSMRPPLRPPLGAAAGLPAAALRHQSKQCLPKRKRCGGSGLPATR